MDAELAAHFPALAAMEAAPPFAALGFRFTDAGEGRAEVTLTPGPQVHNVYGMVHGGAWLFLADSAMGGALGTLAAADDLVITVQFDFRWLRALGDGELVARGRVLRRGREASHCAVDLLDAHGTLLGTGSGTYIVRTSG
jgi:acyl-CoA thioesterase